MLECLDRLYGFWVLHKKMSSLYLLIKYHIHFFVNHVLSHSSLPKATIQPSLSDGIITMFLFFVSDSNAIICFGVKLFTNLDLRFFMF